MARIDRRAFLRRAGAGLVTPWVILRGEHALASEVFPLEARRPEHAFAYGVASGDPTPSGVILWTRVNESVARPDCDLTFTVARDKRLFDKVVNGAVSGAAIGPGADYTVHIDLDGQLDPDQTYYYRFTYGGTHSPIGRCRTLPAPGAPIHEVTFGVLTCQDFTNGFYGTFAKVAVDPTIDFVVHLGDFIYETTGDTSFQDTPFPSRRFTLPGGQRVAFGLDDYRHLYKTYRSDPWFQFALQQHTFIAIWDDHETANDCYWDYARDTLGVPDHPLQTNPAFGNDPAALRRLKLESQQAWAEWLPTRITFDPTKSHPHDAMTIYRHFAFGDLVDLYCTDERTYRSPHPCGEATVGERYATPGCPQIFAPDQTMLGDTQRDWLVDGLTNSNAIWKVWANEVFLGELDVGPNQGNRIVANTDAWDGYAAERRAILEAFRDAGQTNLVALTGDLHTYMTSYLKLDHDDRNNRNPDNVVGVEFMTPAITSANMAELLGIPHPPVRDYGNPILNAYLPRYFLEGIVRATNPHVQFFNSQDHGYSTVRFSRSECEYIAYAVDKTNPIYPGCSILSRQRVAAGGNRIVPRIL